MWPLPEKIAYPVIIKLKSLVCSYSIWHAWQCHHEYTKIHEGIDYLILSNKVEPMLILLPQNYVNEPQFHIIVGMINEKIRLIACFDRGLKM